MDAIWIKRDSAAFIVGSLNSDHPRSSPRLVNRLTSVIPGANSQQIQIFNDNSPKVAFQCRKIKIQHLEGLRPSQTAAYVYISYIN